MSDMDIMILDMGMMRNGKTRGKEEDATWCQAELGSQVYSLPPCWPDWCGIPPTLGKVQEIRFFYKLLDATF